jgi:hypothetical protein
MSAGSLNAAEAHGLALARQRNISSSGISRELCWGAAAVIASGQHCGGLGLGGGPVVLSWPLFRLKKISNR